ncbi:SDR family NAD(P)-dependent oxidoreductase, partial [Streptomyces sp. NPDC020681]|uniref:type I polyketide synthase n=1 Tax=Streptomyces sp. NPDC020681 TaxID=3365083 RepID=UPI0037B5FD7B
EAVAAQLQEQGRKTKPLSVSHAFHSAHMNAMLDEFRAVAATVTYHAPRIPVVSTLTGRMATEDDLRTAEYWAEQVRGTVRFADAATMLAKEGVSAFVEIGPDGVLSALVQEAVESASAVRPLLRRGAPQSATLVAAVGALHDAGLRVDWEAFFSGSGARRVALPTYAFERRRYWLDAGPAAGFDAAEWGLRSTAHPYLGVAVPLAGGEGTVFTGRVAPHRHPWLADQVVVDEPVLPVSALVETVLRAGADLGCDVLHELTVPAPLVIPTGSAVQLQVAVGAPGQDGRRTVRVFARPDDQDATWQSLAEGVLGTGDGPDTVAAGASFEVRMPEWLRDEAGRFGLHPALLDAALGARSATTQPGSVAFPARWRGVRLHATGATEAHASLTETGEDTVAVRLTDANGRLVATVASVSFVEMPEARFSGTRNSAYAAMLETDWVPFTTAGLDGPFLWGVLGSVGTGTAPVGAMQLRDAGAAGAAVASGAAFGGVLFEPGEPDADDPARAAHALTRQVLAVLQHWLADDRLTDTPLVIALRHGAGTDPAAPAASALRGLVRSAQVEAPGRIFLADIDGTPEAYAALASAVVSGEPETSVRGRSAHVPRLRKVAEQTEPAAWAWDPQGTVLVTGGTGSLGGLFARHLVTRHGVRHLLLVGRTGADTPAVTELREELAALGATVTVAAGDVGDRDELARLLGRIPAEHPLTAVVHAAGVVNNATVATLNPEQLATTLTPKADAAWHLHELTRDLPLSAFVLFSSSTGVLGGPGQANYASANAFLDGLARHRVAQGLPAVSIGWGLWERTAGLGAALGDGERARFAREGFRAVTDEQGPALFDAALALGRPVLTALPVDAAALRARGDVPAMLSGLVTVPARSDVRAGAGTEPVVPLADRITGVPAEQRYDVVSEVVRTTLAAVLGHTDADAIAEDRPFQELGFDSLTAVDLRNRLGRAVGLKLPATLVFDFPSPAALTTHVLASIGQEAESGTGGGGSALAELERLEAAIDSLSQEDDERDAVAARLQSLLSRVNGPGVPAQSGAADEIESASADEIFDFIDNELGRTSS